MVTAAIDWAWIGRNADYIGVQTLDHVLFVVQAVGLGFAIAFPLALLAMRVRWLYTPLLQVTGILFTVPALAVFGLLIPFLGLSRANAVVALTLYTLLILLRNTVEGLDGVPDEVLDAAEAMGYTPGRRLVRIQLPLALPVIIAGLRIATVTVVGLVLISAFIGFGGLGDLIIRQGYYRGQFLTPILVGLVLTTALSVTADQLLLALERALTPWRRGAS